MLLLEPVFFSWSSLKHVSVLFICCAFSVGRTKILAGAGIGILGALTGNQGLQQAGGGLVGLGVASSLGAHLLGKKKK